MVRMGSSVQIRLRAWIGLYESRPVAPMVEHQSPKLGVVGSSPTWPVYENDIRMQSKKEEPEYNSV